MHRGPCVHKIDEYYLRLNNKATTRFREKNTLNCYSKQFAVPVRQSNILYVLLLACVYDKNAYPLSRTNTVIIVDNQDNTTFVERTMVEPIDPNNAQWQTNAFHFKTFEKNC